MDKRLKNLLEALKLNETEVPVEFSEPYVEENSVNVEVHDGVSHYEEQHSNEQDEREYVNQTEFAEELVPVDIQTEEQSISYEDEQVSQSNITQTEIFTQEEVRVAPAKQQADEFTYTEEIRTQQDLVDTVSNHQQVEQKDTAVDNRDIFIQRMLDMGFIVNNKKLNTGNLYDFRYSDMGTLAVDINKMFDSAFDFDDAPQSETLVCSNEDNGTDDEDYCEDVSQQDRGKRGLLNKIFNKKRGK